MCALVTGVQTCSLPISCGFTTDGLGVTPGDRLGLVQLSDTEAEAEAFADWFQANWCGVKPNPSQLPISLNVAASHRPPSLLYFKVLYELFRDLGDELDEERIIKSATGIRNTTVWNKLFKFQRDGVVGAIDKLERNGGREEERRVGKEWVSTCRSRWSPYH